MKKNFKKSGKCKKHPEEDVPCSICNSELAKAKEKERNQEIDFDRAENAPMYFDMFGTDEEEEDYE